MMYGDEQGQNPDKILKMIDNSDRNALVLDAAQALAALTSSASDSGSESHSPEERNSSNETDDKNNNPSQMEMTKLKARNVLNLAKKTSKGKAVRFPVKLMHILDCKAYEDVITWAPDGKSFIVLDSAKFVDNVLTFHFKEAKFTSFLRKLYRWGFVKIPQKERPTLDTPAYMHKKFQRDNITLCRQITCHGKHTIKKKQEYRLGHEDGVGQASTASFGVGLHPMAKFNERVEMPLHHLSSIGHRQHLGSLRQSPLVGKQQSTALFHRKMNAMPLMSSQSTNESFEILQNERALQLRNLQNATLIKRRELAALQNRSVNQQRDELTSMRMQLEELKNHGSGLALSRNRDAFQRNRNELQSHLPQTFTPYSTFQRDELLNRNLFLQEKDGLLQEIATKKARQALLEEEALLQELAANRSNQRFENTQTLLHNGMSPQNALHSGNSTTSGGTTHSRIINDAWKALMATRNAVDNFH